MQSMPLAQLSLSWGVDDLDGTVVWYDITKREGGGGTTHQEMHVSTIERLVREAGFTPVERDTIYRSVNRPRDANTRQASDNDTAIRTNQLVNGQNRPFLPVFP